MEPKKLKPEVAAKYDAEAAFLHGQKLVFGRQSKHLVANKALDELTLEEADKLYEAGAVKGVLTLKKVAPATQDKPATK